jgi:hypothetical protein
MKKDNFRMIAHTIAFLSESLKIEGYLQALKFQNSPTLQPPANKKQRPDDADQTVNCMNN